MNIIKHSHQQSSFNSPISSPSSKAETAKLTDESFFEKYYDGGNPFDINQTDIDEIEDVLPVVSLWTLIRINISSARSIM